VGHLMILGRAKTLILCFGLAAAPVIAQDGFRPEIRVNQGTISSYDIDQRLNLLDALGAPAEDLRNTASAQLVDDKLKMQLAERLGIILTDEEITLGVDEFAAQRGVPTEALLARISEFGVDRESLNLLVQSGLVWRKIVQGRYRSKAAPDERDVDDALNLAASAGRESVKLAEIVIPFAERGQNETFALAVELSEELNSGGDFTLAVQDFSRARSAENDGLLDWMPKDRLPQLIAAQTLALEQGGVSGPIPFPEGIVLIKLLDVREESAANRPDVTLTYGVVHLLGEWGELQGRAAALDTCADMRRLAASAGLPDPIVGPVALTGLDSASAFRIARLDAGEADVVPIAGGASILFLCERSSATDEEMRDQMRGQLFSRRIAALGDGLLQELRREAVITYQ
jgi:peptidyl-prolyl cis-trans isomerase SurA